MVGWASTANACSSYTVCHPPSTTLSDLWPAQRPPSTEVGGVRIERSGTPASAHSGSPSVAVRLRPDLFVGIHTIDLTCAVTAREPRRTQPDQAFNPGFRPPAACATNKWRPSSRARFATAAATPDTLSCLTSMLPSTDIVKRPSRLAAPRL